MIISKMLTQHRNDFTAMLTCEYCKHETKLNTGYNDSYYHSKVVPAMVCPSCGTVTNFI